jgi:hypothetical protein
MIKHNLRLYIPESTENNERRPCNLKLQSGYCKPKGGTATGRLWFQRISPSFDDGINWQTNTASLPLNYLVRTKLTNGCRSHLQQQSIQHPMLPLTPTISVVPTSCSNHLEQLLSPAQHINIVLIMD